MMKANGFRRFGGLFFVTVAAILWGGCAVGQSAKAPVWEKSLAWKDAVVGAPVVKGGHVWDAKAVFDSIKIGDPHMAYRSSWVGNTFGGRQEGGEDVSNVLAAMWTAPDGTCYTSSYWDEAGEGGITGDGKHLYVGTTRGTTDLRAFGPDGKFLWQLFSLMFVETYDVDPASDGADIYGTYNHLRLEGRCISRPCRRVYEGTL